MGSDSDADRKTDDPAPSTDVRPDGASVGAADVAILPSGVLDPVYDAKARVLNRAVGVLLFSSGSLLTIPQIQDIGMGRYQWQLFIVVGFGWAADNLWPIVTSLALTPISNEFNPPQAPIFTLSQNIGLLAGAAFWGFGCDVFGRRWGFNLTLGLTALWGLIAAGSPNFAAICIFSAFWSFGVGGNLPVDSAIFLEFLPGSHQYLLTVLSVDWAIAQVVTNLVAWPLLGNFTCQQDQETCTKSENMGWRYFLITMGGLTFVMFFIRFVCFTIFESPKYLMSKGRDEEAVRIVHEVAKRNGKTSDLSIDDLRACEPEGYEVRTDVATTLKRHLEELDASQVKVLFSTKNLALSTGLIMAVWALIGLGYPLYNAFLPYIQAMRGVEFEDGSTYITYRNNLIIAVLGVPGSLLGGVLVELPYIGRKGALFGSTTLTGVFLYCSTIAKSSTQLLGWNCAYNFCSSTMYAVLYGYTPELFPTPQRGTGNALTATCNRIFGVMAVCSSTPIALPVLTISSLSLPCLPTSRPRLPSIRAARSSLLLDSLSSSCRMSRGARRRCNQELFI